MRTDHNHNFSTKKKKKKKLRSLRSYHFAVEVTFKCHFMLKFLKKNSLKSNIVELARPWKFSVWPLAAIEFLFGFCWFPDTCRQLRKTKTGRFKAEELVVTGKIFFWLSQKEKFLELMGKNPYIFNYWWVLSMSIALYLIT